MSSDLDKLKKSIANIKKVITNKPIKPPPEKTTRQSK